MHRANNVVPCTLVLPTYNIRCLQPTKQVDVYSFGMLLLAMSIPGCDMIPFLVRRWELTHRSDRCTQSARADEWRGGFCVATCGHSIRTGNTLVSQPTSSSCFKTCIRPCFTSPPPYSSLLLLLPFFCSVTFAAQPLRQPRQQLDGLQRLFGLFGLSAATRRRDAPVHRKPGHLGTTVAARGGA